MCAEVRNSRVHLHLVVGAVLTATCCFADLGVGSPTRVGPLSKEEISRTLKRNLPLIRSCYAAALERQRETQGEVAVRFTIGPTGEVISADLAAQTVRDERLAACVVGIVTALRFPKPRGGGQVVVTYPFRFEP